MKRPRNVNGNNTFCILHLTTRRQSIANPPMEDSNGSFHMNIDADTPEPI